MLRDARPSPLPLPDLSHSPQRLCCTLPERLLDVDIPHTRKRHCTRFPRVITPATALRLWRHSRASLPTTRGSLTPAIPCLPHPVFSPCICCLRPIARCPFPAFLLLHATRLAQQAAAGGRFFIATGVPFRRAHGTTCVDSLLCAWAFMRCSRMAATTCLLQPLCMRNTSSGVPSCARCFTWT
jgi:hypothetical protein